MGAGLATTAEDKKQDSSRESSGVESPQWERSRFAPSGQGAWGDAPGDSAKGSRPVGAPSGMPLFLQTQVQMKCAECAKEEEEEKRAPQVPVQKKCAHCEEEEKRQRDQGMAPVQAKCAACEAEGLKEKSTSGAALDGVASANRSLPHLDRIQASFGRHDVSGTRAAVGGPAAEASGRMGALAYTSGDRVAFRSEPDVNLAAHEAAHVVQQRNGAKLPGGVGRPGDGYEQQADAAAEAVERGDSAEAILDSPVSGDSGGGDSAPAVQHRLEVNATRTFEPASARSDVKGGEGEGHGKGKAAGGKPAPKRAKPGAKADEKEKEETGEKKGGGAPKASVSAPSAQTPGSGPPSGTQPVPQAGRQAPAGQGPQPGGASANQAPAAPVPQPGASPEAAPGASPATAAPSSAPDAGTSPAGAAGAGASAAAGAAGASCAPECYRGKKEEPTGKDKTDEKPKDVQGGKSEEQTNEDDVPDAPEPDDCKTQQAQAGVPPASQEGAAPGGGGAPAASAGPALGAASTPEAPAGAPPAPAPAGPAPAGAPQPATGGGKAPAPAGAEKALGAAGGGAAGGGGGGQAPAGGKGEKAPSPIEASIAQGEAQRSAAVASYEASSQALDGAAANSAELRSGIEFAAPAGGGSEQVAQHSAASARATGFFSDAADSLEQSIAFASVDAPDQLGAQTEAGKAQILASAEAEKDAVSARIAAARAEARGDAAVARRAVVHQAESFVEQVHTSSAAAIASLTASHATTLGQVDALETTTLDQVNQIYAAGRTQMEGLGVTIGNECTTIGERFAGTYEGFAECTENGFWDGDLSQRRAHAQAEAAGKTAKGYHDTIVKQAKKRAREVVKAGRKQNRCQVITTASASREQLDKTLAQITTTIEGARDHAIAQAASTRATLLATIDSSLHAILRQLDQQEHEQRQMIDDTCYLQQVTQEQMAHSAAASLQGLVTSGASALHDSLFMLRSQFASNQAPDPKALDETLTAVSDSVDAALESMREGLLGGTAAAVEQLDAALGAGLAALDRLIAVNVEAISAISSGFGSSMGAISGQDNFAPQRAGFMQMMQQTTAGGIDQFQKILGGMRDGCGKTTADSQKSLKQAASDLEKNLLQSKQGLECQITKDATEAASREAPAWKRLIAIYLIIIVIIIVIAVTVLTAGAGLGLLAVILIGAAVGAVTSGLIAIATNLWTNQPWHQGVVKAMVIGAITGAAGGAIGFGIGAALGKLAPLAASLIGQTAPKVAVEVASTILSTAVIDVGSQFYEHGFSLKNFSWGQLGFDLALALVMHGVGKAAEPHGVKVGAPEAPPHPTEAPIEPTAAPMEPAPAEPTVGAEAVPPEAAPAPKPAEAAPPEAALEVPTPSEAKPPEPVAGEPPTPEAAPPEPAAPEPKEPGAPSEQPVPEEATPAAPGEAPTTPQERQVLERTATKSGEELTPEEVLTEREVANRTEGEPVEDPPFTTKKKLPNGHEIEETPQGEEMQRCSDACAVFDKNGKRMGTVTAGPEGVVEHPVSTPEVEHAPPGRGPSAEPEFSASPEAPKSVEELPSVNEAPREPAEVSPSDPDVLNVPEEGEGATVGELKDEFSARKPWEPPEGAAPRPPADASPDAKLNWLKERLQAHVDAAVQRYEVEGLTPGQEAAVKQDPRSLSMRKGSQIDAFAKETIMQDPELADLITAPDYVPEPDILPSEMPKGPDWFDITTRRAWAAHVAKYGARFGFGHLLPY